MLLAIRKLPGGADRRGALLWTFLRRPWVSGLPGVLGRPAPLHARAMKVDPLLDRTGRAPTTSCAPSGPHLG
jgi:hypothetical protein